jgi:predicted ATPase
MINLIKLQNFKCFESQLLQFKPLTMLSGLNSSGKSSVLQSLLLLRQSYQQGLLPDKGLALNGDLVSIGTAQDALFENAKEEVISFEINWDNKLKGDWSFKYNQESEVLNLTGENADFDVYQTSLFRDNFHYLQAERNGPIVYSDISDFPVKMHKQIGTQGEFTPYFLSAYREKPVHKNLAHPQSKSLELRFQVEAWLGEISPGTRLTINDNSQLDLVSLQYSYSRSNNYRATNVGFGISYVLPIIVAILASESGALILIENPEAHLHPKGQSQMGKLMALAASCGIQIIVETHSDHVLNGVCLAVHGGKLRPEDVQLNFFERWAKEEDIITKVVSPVIDQNGRIDYWPDGFFDEWEKSLDILLEPAVRY